MTGYATSAPCCGNIIFLFTGCHLVATAASEDGKMVAVILPLFFSIQALVTLINAQNPGKCKLREKHESKSIYENCKDVNVCV
jgi:hypothetical protein